MQWEEALRLVSWRVLGRRPSCTITGTQAYYQVSVRIFLKHAFTSQVDGLASTSGTEEAWSE